MNRRIIAMAAGFAVMVLAGAQPAAADQCTAACDKNFSTCNGTNPDTSKCLPMWGQCKRTCAGPVTPAKVVTKPAIVPAAKVTKAANVKVKAPAVKAKAKAGDK
jgi:hypothetical protein